jgi:NDP-sugar pyrophosphorylase family protein
VSFIQSRVQIFKKLLTIVSVVLFVLNYFSDCEALTMGNHNVFEAKSFVGKSVTITDGCVIGAKCQIDIKETIPNNTVIFGEKCVRRQQASHPPVRL